MSTETADPLDRTTPAGLLARGVNTVRSLNWDPTLKPKIRENLRGENPVLLADALALAMTRLAEPARLGDFRTLRDELAEAVFDAAHEGCGDGGCSGGGLKWWQEYVDNVLMPVLRRHAVPPEDGGDE